MPDKIDYTSPPVEGPFMIIYEFAEHEAGRWERRKTVKATEADAVGFWRDCQMYINMRPVDITPEPRWNRYTLDGRTPRSR